MDLELLNNMPHVPFHGVRSNPQAPGHRRRIVSLGQQPENLELARGELSQKRLVLPLIGRQTALPRDGLREKGDRDQDLFLSRAPYRFQYLLGRS